MNVAVALTPGNSQCETLIPLLVKANVAHDRDGCWLDFLPQHPLGHYGVAIIHLANPFLGRWMNETDKPYLLLDSKDGADLGSVARKLLQSDRPPAVVWKKSRYRDPSLYNQFHGRWHVQLMKGDVPMPRPPRPVPPAMLGRIQSRFGFGSFDYPQLVLKKSLDYLDSNAWGNRPIDVSFAGTVEYDASPVEVHRQRCCEAIERLHVRSVVVHRNRALNFGEYCDLLFKSKIVVCPMGWGEMGYRFYEAIFAGCLVITPPMGHVEEWQTPFQCRLDFADLPEVVDRALDFWEQQRDTRNQWRNEMIHRTDPRVTGDALWSDLRSAMSPSAAAPAPTSTP